MTNRLGPYELLSRVGRGGMADVFRARALEGPLEGQSVALKRLLPERAKNPDDVALFMREADLSLRLMHPNVVRTLEVRSEGETSFLVMEYVDGRDLGQILRRCKQRGLPLPVDFGVFLVRTLLEALSYAHGLGLVHCDVSPSNLFISRTGEIKLGDFGVARRRIEAREQTEIDGKPYYLSPEVLTGDITPLVDLWAANVVLYETLTLERPFVGATPDAVLGAVRRREYVPLRSRRSEISPVLEGIVHRGFAMLPDQRFVSAREMGKVLESHYDERVGTPLAIAAVVRGLFGAENSDGP